MARIGFIGLGKMGLGMAGRLLAAGHSLRVYNRTPSKAAPLVEMGALLCASPAEACRDAEAVIVMVADDEASREVWLGADGALSGRLTGGQRTSDGRGASGEPAGESAVAMQVRTRLAPLAIECSTLSYDWVTELAAAAKAHGFRYIDAPVTGLPANAAAGELTLLVGADPTDLEAARMLLEAFSQRIIHFGAVGTGTAYKLIVNMLGAIQIASAAESMALAERAGLDLHAVADAIAAGQAASPQVVRNTRRMVAGDSDRSVIFTPRLRLKDVDYALRLANKLDLGTPFGTLAAQAFRQLCLTGRGEENESNVIEVARTRRSH
jgi:3-hydroxyisobutyrate dehydrogenase